MKRPISIFSHTSESYACEISSRLGKGREHARLLYQEWFREGSCLGKDPHFNNAQTLLEQILTLTDFSFPTILRKKEEEETEKYLLQTEDQLEIEMVLLPMQAGITLCISSQIGCQMGCAFCETGKMGLIRHLSTEEIVSQLFQAKYRLGASVRNIVFMGMGEPFDNYEAVMQAIRIFTDPNGFGLGASRITVSTSGLVDQIKRFTAEADPAINLAISVNAPNDAVRNRLMPVNHRYPMGNLRQAMEDYCKNARRKIFAEYVMIAGRNDGLQDAEMLADYLQGLNITINLIPYNAQSRGCFKAPGRQTVDIFAAHLRSKGFLVFIRDQKGEKIMAACGQLGNLLLRKKLAFSSERDILSRD